MAKRQQLHSFDELETLLNRHNLLRQFSIRRLGVFGSFARNETAHDIDLLIEDPISLETAAQFQIALQALVDNELDIMLERLANPIVLYRARKDLRYVEG